MAVNSYNCVCLTRDISQIAGGLDTTIPGTGSPLTTHDCNFDTQLAALNNNAVLMGFLKNSYSELKTPFNNPNGTYVNICNNNRTVNIITLYLAAFLGSHVNIATIVNSFVYEPPYTYPRYIYSPVAPTPPVNVANYPNIEQAYWTIAAQYTVYNEYYLRAGKDGNWCPDQANCRTTFPLLRFKIVCVEHCSENPIYVLPEKELRSLGSSLHSRVSVSDLYIPRIGPHTRIYL